VKSDVGDIFCRSFCREVEQLLEAVSIRNGFDVEY
jgi:hypothetical protein